jgi:hypothetical protein
MLVRLEFIEAPVFTELLPRYLSDEEYRELQWHLARNPEAGGVIRARADSARCGGPIEDEGREGGVACTARTRPRT